MILRTTNTTFIKQKVTQTIQSTKIDQADEDLITLQVRIRYIIFFVFILVNSNSVLACFIFFIAFGPIYIYHVLRCFDIDIPMNHCYIVDQWLKMLPWLRRVFEIARYAALDTQHILCHFKLNKVK